MSLPASRRARTDSGQVAINYAAWRPGEPIDSPQHLHLILGEVEHQRDRSSRKLRPDLTFGQTLDEPPKTAL